MNKEFRDIIKKSEAFKLIKRDIETQSFNHAYIILSSDIEAINLLIEQICLFLYCKSGGCMECAECIKVLKKSKPDIREPNLEGEALKVEQISSIISDSHLTAFEKGKKLYIIRNLENSSERVQNKLLKTLEEPNADVHFILTTPSLQGVLPTIASRVKHVNLTPFADVDIESVLTSRGYSDANTLAKCSGGSITSALKLTHENKHFEKIHMMLDCLCGMEKSEDVVKYLSSPVFEDINEAMDIVELIFYDLLIINNDMDTLTLKREEHILREIAKNFNKRSITACFAAINTARHKIRANCNKINIIDSLFLRMLEVRNKCR